MLVEKAVELDEFSSLGVLHVSHIGFGGRMEEDCFEVLDGSSQELLTRHPWEGIGGEPEDLVYNAGFPRLCGPDSEASVVLHGWSHIPCLKGMCCPCVAFSGSGVG